MRKLILACAVLWGCAAPGTAAEIPVPGPYLPPAPPLAVPLYSWTGCHGGVNIGGGAAPQSWTDINGVFPGDAPGTSLNGHTARGVAGGWQLGCDYQVGAWVFGLEGRYDLTGMKADNLQPNGLYLNNSFVQTLGMLTARVGYTATPTLLLYGKAGGALVHNLYDASIPSGNDLCLKAGTMIPFPMTPGQPASCGPPAVANLFQAGYIIALGAHTSNGWTAGAGLEWALYYSNWSLFLEYDYMSFGTSQTTFTSTLVPGLRFPLDIKQSVNIVLVGMNWRFWGGNRHY
jgi:outer membrane immunogenic protein